MELTMEVNAMTAGIDKAADQALLDATLTYVAAHPDTRIDGFREPVANWGKDWSGVSPAHLAASDILEQSLPQTSSGTRALMEAYVRERATRYWEQSYTSADKAVGDDMLANYGYAEIIGKRGPFVSDRVRAGVGVFGPNVDYPPHRHQAEEIYVILAGSAEFRLGDDADPEVRNTGNVIHVPSMLTHGFRMTDDPLVIFYLWQSGDLREKSTFV